MKLKNKHNGTKVRGIRGVFNNPAFKGGVTLTGPLWGFSPNMLNKTVIMELSN